MARQLKRQNLEYDTKRATLRLGPLRVSILPGGTWEQFTRTRLAESGGTSEQYKHPCLVPSLDFIRQFRVIREAIPRAQLIGRKLA